MSESITISFVIPAYNEERLLPACLQAIQAEIARMPGVAGVAAAEAMEIVVVDNASRDRTAAIAAGFPGVVVVNEPRKGLVHARRAGFEAARGALVANIDADTLIPPGWLARVLAEFERDAQLVAISGPYDYYDAPPRVRWAARVFYAAAFVPYLVNRHVLNVGSMVQGGNFTLRRAALEQAGGFDDRFTFYGEDTDIARRMHKVGRVKFTWALTARSSGRRLRGDGLVMTGLRYGANYVWATFLRRPFTTAWNDYR